MIFNKTSDSYLEHDFDGSLGVISGTVGGLLSTFLMYLGVAYVSVIAEGCLRTPSWHETESMAVGINTVESVLNIALGTSMDVSGDSSPALPGSMLLSPTTSTAGEAFSVNATNETHLEEAIENFLISFRHDAVPYNRVEKSAERIYNGIQRNRSMEPFPVVFTDEGADYEALRLIYGDSFSAFINNLDILEASLENGCGQSN